MENNYDNSHVVNKVFAVDIEMDSTNGIYCKIEG